MTKKDHAGKKEALPRIVEQKCERKIRARGEKPRTLYFGLGVFGVVGWSVAIPTVLGILIGRWLDAHSKLPISWTLTMLFAGVAVGGVIAWQWVNKQGRAK